MNGRVCHCNRRYKTSRGRIVLGANRRMRTHLGVGESTVGRYVHRANRPWGESSSVWAKRPWGEKYSGRSVWKPCLSCHDILPWHFSRCRLTTRLNYKFNSLVDLYSPYSNVVRETVLFTGCLTKE